MKIISWNLLHRSGATLDQVKTLIAEHHPDLLLMQEATGAMDPLPDQIGGQYVRNVLPGCAHGLAAWSPVSRRYSLETMTLPPGMVVKRICQIIEFEDFSVANVHLSHGQVLNRRQLRRICQILPSHAAILGDCNLLGPALLPGFLDVGPRDFTHVAGAVLPLRLDRCFVRGLRCENAQTLDRGDSDHRPIVVSLSVPVKKATAAGNDPAVIEAPSDHVVMPRLRHWRCPLEPQQATSPFQENLRSPGLRPNWSALCFSR